MNDHFGPGAELGVDPLITDTADRLFGELASADTIERSEATGAAPELWAAFADSGFPWISVPTESGGSGGTLIDALEVLRLVGYHAAPVPAAETGILGGWLLSSAGLELGDAMIAVSPQDTLTINSDGTVSGTLSMVPWGRHADRVVAIVAANVASIPVAEAKVIEQRSLAGEPRDTLVFDHAAVDLAPCPAGIDRDALWLRGALSRTAMMAGAIDKMSQLTVTYTHEREQFGRPIARFQAVQAHLVWAAQDAALAHIAATAAGRAAMRGRAEFEIASAKLNCNQAATRSTRACHQAHGAMGMTKEYPLHHYSRRLWAWRSEYGSTREWAIRVGRLAIAGGGDGLYPLITGDRGPA